MAEIFSSEEQTSIMNEAPLQQDRHHWIGLTDSAVEGHYIWQHSSKSLSWSNWIKGEPNNHGDNEHCILLDYGKNWQWQDLSCGRSFFYVGIHALCEYRH